MLVAADLACSRISVLSFSPVVPLSYKVGVRKYAYFTNSLEFELLTLSNELCLKLEISVEMFFDCAFPFAYYHKNICDTKCDSLINYVLNYAGKEPYKLVW